ncbi:hypothetical protein FACS1894127_5740 [Clostridia bacterium]|nr:hypothetical protein FACS1894127_5740 [Clostridia bacterium]
MVKPVSYLQTDPKWKNAPYAAPGENATIGGSGCGPTSAAMVIATWASRVVTPVEACKWSLDHGFKAKGQGTYYSYFAPQGAAFGLEFVQVNYSDLRYMNADTAKIYHTKAMSAIRDEAMVIACMGKGLWTSSGHFILWYGYDQGSVYINDPNSTESTRLTAPLDLFQHEVKYYFVCKKPPGRAIELLEAENILMDKAGLSVETVQYLSRDYRFGQPLTVKLATAIIRAAGELRDIKIQDAKTLIQKTAGLDDNTMLYLSFYKFSDPLILKLAHAML